MADLTPPSSKPSTPLRAADAQANVAPGSPSSRHTSAPGHPLISSSTASLTEGSRGDVEMEQLDNEDEESDSLSGLGEDGGAFSGGDEVMSDADGDASDDELALDSGSKEEQSTASKGESLGTKLKNAFNGKSKDETSWKQTSKRQRAPKAKGKEYKEPAAAGKRGKDADLYESDIVARWNREFGDVLYRPPAKGPAQSQIPAQPTSTSTTA